MSTETPSIDEIKQVADSLGKLLHFEIKSGEFPAAGKTFEIGGVTHIMRPNNCELTNMEKSLPAPARIRALVGLRDLDSFLAYVAGYKLPASKIFVATNSDGLKATAIFDYPASATETAWGSHRVLLATQFSAEWLRWRTDNDTYMSQKDFAEFIETNALQFASPSGADMLTMARDIEVKQNVEWRGTVRTENGDTSINYVNTSKAGAGDIEVPALFTIGIRPFHNGATYKLDARLRVSLDDGTLTLKYELLRTEELLEQVMQDIIANIAGSTGIAPLVGDAPQII